MIIYPNKSIVNNKTIALIGMPCSGKTTVGAILAKKLKRELIDLDSFIENIAGKRIHDFFKTGGEPEFRRAETQLLKFIIYRYKKHTSQHDNGLIVATGGGIVTV